MSDFIEKKVTFPFSLGGVDFGKKNGAPLVRVNIDRVLGGVEYLQLACHGLSQAAGWWHDSEGNPITDFNVAEKLCLIHSEISEAMEGDRKGLMDDKLPHRKMIEVELADAVIRIADLAGGMGLDLAGALVEKLEYNAGRPDHKPENRAEKHGKKY